MPSCNERLRQLYEESLLALRERFSCQDFLKEMPTNPLLLCVDERYTQASSKVMYCGKETNDWEGDFPKSTDDLIATFRGFYLSGECFRYDGQFWNGIARFERRLQDRFPGRSIGFVWNNIIKLGKSGAKGLPSARILALQSQWFSVVAQETAILDPHIVVFFTGPDYDQFILKAFPDARFTAHPTRGLRAVGRIAATGLPDSSFRTYHPNYLWRTGDINGYLDDVINWIRVA
jgi:hypothetical protein